MIVCYAIRLMMNLIMFHSLLFFETARFLLVVQCDRELFLPGQTPLMCECFVTNFTYEKLFSGMDTHVAGQILLS